MNEQQLILLRESLLYLHVSELKEVAQHLKLPHAGKKIVLIERIISFLSTGSIIVEPKIPKKSRAQSGKVYSLAPQALMLKGAYKNDLQTRLFFKKLIGEHFHFTAFGIDWLNERWFAGNPPTYQEFADMWTAEQQRRKQFGSKPKEEWALINFTQCFVREYSEASREGFFEAWKRERLRHVHIVQKLLGFPLKRWLAEP